MELKSVLFSLIYTDIDTLMCQFVSHTLQEVKLKQMYLFVPGSEDESQHERLTFSYKKLQLTTDATILLQFVRAPAISFQNKCLKMLQHVMKFGISGPNN